jgi:splicing factor 3A subunit 1
LFVARSANPPQFEDKIREGQRTDPKFSFLNPIDPYHAYYRHRMERIAAGDTGEDAPAEKKGTEVKEGAPVEVVDVGVEPPAPEFIMDFPNISRVDLCVSHLFYFLSSKFILACRDIMNLTALFTAQRGRNFLANLSAREGRNYQFDFLRPTHSLFGYFNRLVEQYTKVLHPDKKMLERLKERSEDGGRWKTLEMARKYATWEKNKREKDKKRQDDQEAERSACSHFLVSLW